MFYSVSGFKLKVSFLGGEDYVCIFDLYNEPDLYKSQIFKRLLTLKIALMSINNNHCMFQKNSKKINSLKMIKSG